MKRKYSANQKKEMIELLNVIWALIVTHRQK